MVACLLNLLQAGAYVYERSGSRRGGCRKVYFDEFVGTNTGTLCLSRFAGLAVSARLARGLLLY